MRILIYSDVHGNLPAFETMISLEDNVSRYICLGDLVNYGPWSNECVELALSLPNSTIIKGNHEEDFIKGAYSGSNNLVKMFFEKSYQKFTKIHEVSQFLHMAKLDGFICTHTVNNMNIYPDTDMHLNGDFIIGHSHHQFCYSNNGFRLFNSGSVGQNRKYINEINYLIYNTETKSISMKSALYDVDLVINQMKNENYPQICLDYYLEKERKVSI